MKSHFHDTKRYIVPTLLAAILGFASPARGQGDNPFDENATDEAAEAQPAPPIDLSQYGPAVRTVMEAERKTPDEILQGVLLLIDLREPDLAKPLFDKLTSAAIDDPAKAALARRFGSGRMMRLGRAKSLGPEAAQFADACMAAFAAEVRDPKRMGRLVADLADPAPEVRHAAMVDLAEAGQDGATFCVESLVRAAEEGAAAEQMDGLRAVLIEFGPLGIEPLIAAMSASNPAAKSAVIKTLGAVAPRKAMPYLLAPAIAGPEESVQTAAIEVLQNTTGRLPTPSQAVAALAKTVNGYLAGQLPVAPDENDAVEVWAWIAQDGEQQGSGTSKLVARKVAKQDASIIAASRLARDLANLAPQNTAYQTLALLCRLHTAKVAGGLDTPLPDSVKQTIGADVATLDRVLAEALRRDLVPAAIAATELLGERADIVAIYGHAPSNAPLVEALRHGDRRLRFTALAAVIRLNPLQPYPGASRVVDGLEYFLRGAQRRAVVAMPDLQRAQTIAGWVSARDLDPIPVGTGRQAVMAALGAGDIDLVLLDAEIARPGVREVLYQLRNSPRVGRAVVGLLAGPRSFEQAKQIAASDRRTDSFARPQDAAAAGQIIEKLMRLAGRSQIAPEVRAKQAAAALDWTRKLLAAPQSFYDLRRLEPAVLATLFSPELAGQGAAALGHFGSADTQRALIDLASRPHAPIEHRQTAAGSFRQSVARHGIQLTRDEILRQYDRYNASERADRQSQEVLGQILDTIEKRGG